MKMLMGFVFGVLVATALPSLAQYWQQPGQTLDLSVGTPAYQQFWQEERVRDLEMRPSYRDPCGR